MKDHMSEDECVGMADFFSVFSNATRLKIFCALQGGKKTVSELAEISDASMQNVSQHLRVMRDRGALVTNREGQCIFYDVSDPRLFESAKIIREVLVDRKKKMATFV